MGLEDEWTLPAPVEETSALQTAQAGTPAYTTEDPVTAEIDGDAKPLPRENKPTGDSRVRHNPGKVFGADTRILTKEITHF